MTQEINFNKIQGTLVYVQMNEPVKAFTKPGAPVKPDEWKASVVLVDEDYVDALEAYGKSLDTLLSIKKVKAAEFPEKYKCDLPEGASKNVWILTFRKSTELGKTGKPVPDLYKPKVYEKVGNKMIEITTSKLVGNGSQGTISVDRFDRTSGGSSLYLKNLLVTELVEYIKQESDYEAGSEFDEDVETSKTPASKPKVETKVQPKKAKPPVETDSEDDPF